MLPIYICEDDETQLNYLKKLINNTILIESLDATVACATTAPKQLLSYLTKHNTPALYFLDVELNDSLDGFMLAKEIRSLDPRGFIVFITTHSELSHLAFKYKVEAMDYLIKDNRSELPDRVRECIFNAFDLYTASTNTVQKAIALKVEDRMISLKLEEIYSIETSTKAHRIRIHKKNGYTELFYSLRSISPLLDDSFFQCHKSCIINLSHVKEVDKKNYMVIFENGRTSPVATRLLQPLLNRLQ